MTKYGEYEMVNGATLNAANERIKELEEMLTVIWEYWSCDECPETEKMEEIMKSINKST